MKERTIYALGFFDGVHLGHAALLTACRAMADENGCRAGVVTFGNHPDALVFGAAPALITPPRERERLMRERFSMDCVIELPFDRTMMQMPWEDFYNMLRRDYGAAGIVCGEDFRFGAHGAGSGESLMAVCRRDGLPCTVVPQRTVDGIVISSTHIRNLICDGKMESATRFLGHPYLLSGTVMPGRQLGRSIGVPTANLKLPDGLAVPKFGVYACRTTIGGKTYCAVTNIGTRPTVSGSGVTVEPWILDFEGDLYGKELALEFYRFLRPEMKFPDLAALQREIHANAEETRAYFAKLQEAAHEESK